MPRNIYTSAIAGLLACCTQASLSPAHSSVVSEQKKSSLASAKVIRHESLIPKRILAQATPQLRGMDGPRPSPSTAQPESPPKIRGLDASPVSKEVADTSLEQVRIDAAETAGTLFISDDQVMVKPPVLQALITLNRSLSPYNLDSQGSRPVNLANVLQDALQNNLTIKISNTDFQTSRWLYISSLGGFLPDITNGLSMQELRGKYASPFGLLSKVNSPFMSIPTGLQWNFFKGGSVIFGALQTKHAEAAAGYALKGTMNDILLDATTLYYRLVLNDILLQIRIKAVETSKALVIRNQIQYDNGANTKLDVLEARSQLSKDRQALITQQIARRQAAIKLATALNLNPGTDLKAEDGVISKIRLVDDNLMVADLLQVAIDNRPELKKYEQLRLAAKDAVKVAFAPLLPQIYGTVGGITTGAKVTSLTSGPSASSAAAGSVAGGSFSSSSASPSGIGGGKKKFTATELFQIGINLQWTIGGLGVTEVGKIQAAKWQARKAQLEFSKSLADVYQDVRDAYLDAMEADNLIAETTDAVNAAREQLEVATVRLEESVGTDLEVVNAQRDFTDALISKANAIINFNIAQGKLLRAMGKISTSTLTATRPLVK